MMGLGFVVSRFGLFLHEVQIAQKIPIRSYGFSVRLGIALIVLGAFVEVLAAWYHVRLIRGLDRGEQIGHAEKNHAVIIAFVLALIGLAMAFYLFSM